MQKKLVTRKKQLKTTIKRIKKADLEKITGGGKTRVANEIVVGAWQFDENRRTFGYWTSDVGRLDLGFVETGPWIEYPELHPERWARLPARPTESDFI